MNLKEYQEFVKSKTCKDGPQGIHALLGLSSELGELCDWVKRDLFYGKPPGDSCIDEELGDLMFYACMLATSYGLSMEQVLSNNIEKLNKRYAGGFTKAEAVGRADKNGANDR